jgi:hypothetical protein
VLRENGAPAQHARTEKSKRPGRGNTEEYIPPAAPAKQIRAAWAVSMEARPKCARNVMSTRPDSTIPAGEVGDVPVCTDLSCFSGGPSASAEPLLARLHAARGGRHSETLQNATFSARSRWQNPYLHAAARLWRPRIPSIMHGSRLVGRSGRANMEMGSSARRGVGDQSTKAHVDKG